jgi:murein DD-endopeptidase MepM/ murein hydrolase activator NlpD
MITHSNGLQTWYLHAMEGSECIAFSTDKNTPCAKNDSKARNANLGKKVWVTRGQVIANVGKTGTSGVHLHFEVRSALEQPVDPFACADTVRQKDWAACPGNLWLEEPAGATDRKEY